MDDLERAIDGVVHTCLGVRPGENVVVVVDEGTRAIGDRLRAAAGSEAVLVVMAPRGEHGQEPPPAVAAALERADVFIAPTTKSLSHTRARKAATEHGARGATLPGVTEDLLARCMAADLQALKQRSNTLAQLLTDADEARLTCPKGSEFTFDLRGRTGMADDGDLTQPGAFGNLPCGEGFISPRGGRGRLMIHPEGELIVEDGRLTHGEPLRSTLVQAGELGTNLAELGIGTNERAQLTGNILEDEKILGTVHIAFGASAGIGGTVSVPVHIDSVVTEPTLTIGDTTVIEGGRFLL